MGVLFSFSVWRKFWATSSPASPENQPWLQFVSNRSVICCVNVLNVCVCGLNGASTEQCAAPGATPHRVILVPADRDCKGIGLLCDGSIHSYSKRFTVMYWLKVIMLEKLDIITF